MIKNNKGFTLIELLVVIAIIGVLASVVLAATNTARNKGADAAVKANMANARAQASLYYDNNTQSYGTASVSCATGGSNVFDTQANGGIGGMIAAAVSASGGTPNCGNSTAAWAAAVPLKTSGNWCVDSTGYSGATTKSITTTSAGSVAGDIACQ